MISISHEALRKISSNKIIEGVFDGPQIREMLRFDHFEATISKSQKQVWLSFKWVCSSFSGNNHDLDYEICIQTCLNHIKE